MLLNSVVKTNLQVVFTVLSMYYLNIYIREVGGLNVSGPPYPERKTKFCYAFVTEGSQTNRGDLVESHPVKVTNLSFLCAYINIC